MRWLNERLRWALSYLKPYALALSGVVILAFIQNYAFAMLPMASTNFLFELLTPERINTIYRYFAIAIGLLIAKALFGFFTQYSTELIANAALKKIRDEFFSHLMVLGLPFFAEQKTGNVVSIAISDVEEIKLYFYRGIISILGNSFLLIIIMTRLFILNWLLTLISLVALPTLFFVVRFLGNKIRDISKVLRKNLGSISTNIHETLTGIEVVKAFATEERETENFEVRTKTYKRTYSKLVMYMSFIEPFTEMIVLIIVMGLVGVGSIFIIRGEWEVKMLTEYLILLGILNAPIRSIPRGISNFKTASASIDRIRNLLNIEPQIVENEHPVVRDIEGEIAFEDVSFSYDDENDVLKDISFHVKKGEIIALVGPSGAGKTTIANLIPRFYDCKTGAISIDGINVKDYSLTSLRRQIGIVSQNISLFNTTIRDNICYARPDASDEEIIEAAKQAYAYDFIVDLPKGFETKVGERGVKLSGGQKQRISIARAVLMSPEILVLDEATSALDSESEHYIQLALNELMEGRTSVIIAHRLSTVNHANKILVVDKGEAVDMGTHEELIDRCALYSKIYDLQYFR